MLQPRSSRPLVIALAASVMVACSAMLPRSETVTETPWESFDDAQKVFDKITPYQTTVADLRSMKIDPVANPNVTILSYSDVLMRFVPSPSIDPATVDGGVMNCIRAAARCQGFEIDHRVIRRHRFGNFWADLFNFQRKTDIVGWRFKAVLLITDGVVVYKLTGGQPTIHEQEENHNPLGPFQGMGEALRR